MEQVKLYDTTLRDGMGGHGMSLSVGEKLKVVEALDGLGVHFIEAGFPSSNPKEAEFFERLAAGRPRELDGRRLRDDQAPRPAGVRGRVARGPRRLLRAGDLSRRQGLQLSGRKGDPRHPRGEPGDGRRLLRLLRRPGQAGVLRRRALLRRLPRRRGLRARMRAGGSRRGGRERHPLRHQRRQPARRSSARRPRQWSRRSAMASRSEFTPTTTPSARSPTASPRSRRARGWCRGASTATASAAATRISPRSCPRCS